ncbi:hypothetical protein O3P69_018566 [Scylla paramamosain]|uniref:Uncharacterized protein n=1 Tax=Scylla paramamosain TaxID=85552 RepID=A0AAW0T1W4_SCYPA
MVAALVSDGDAGGDLGRSVLVVHGSFVAEDAVVRRGSSVCWRVGYGVESGEVVRSIGKGRQSTQQPSWTSAQLQSLKQQEL